ncbi:MAG: undecaprenyl-phosphate glucose phosphotransferase [Pirellulales bacterium]|nr:undecaprenyl-phosphate glucose phosphotransferase [Pirellulales bacterium]
MNRRHAQFLALAFFVGDIVVTATAWVTAYAVRFTLLPAPGGVPEMTTVLAGLPTILVLAAVAYHVCGMYRVGPLRRLAREANAVSLASGLLFLLVIAVTFYRRDLYESRLGLAMFFVLNATMLIGVRRFGWRLFAHHRGQTQRVAVVGDGRNGRRVAETLLANSWAGLRPVGFVERTDIKHSTVLPRLGEIHQLKELIDQHQIDQVLIALPLSRYGELPGVYHALSDVLVEVQLAPEIPDLSGMTVRPCEVDRLSFIGLRENPHAGWREMAKRATDIVLGSAALLLLAPLMLLLAAMVKLTSRGPVLYRQMRAGLAGKEFGMLKFRSMRIDAESQTGPVWAKAGDERCTAVGRFMRRWSLDELPQLLNVLAGQMSLVGPRPERHVFIEKFRRQIPNYTQRHQVKAGITGWAQVNGWRGNTSLRRRIECDLYYICNWSLLLDLKILVMTIWCGLRHRNAY